MSKTRAALRHPTALPKRDVTIGYCRPTQIDGVFAERLQDVHDFDWMHGQRIRKRVFIESGPRIAAARNRVVANFLLDPDSHWLWMVDTDMTFEADILDRMLDAADADERPILGALCFAGGRDFRIAPTIYVANPDAPEGELNLQIHFDYPDNALIRVHGTGAACILIHRSVLEAMHDQNRWKTVYPWFAETEIPPNEEAKRDGKDIGEDITFCLRAGQLGFPVYMHTGIKTGHRKTMTLSEDEYLANRAHILEVGEEEARRQGLARIGVTPADAPKADVA